MQGSMSLGTYPNQIDKKSLNFSVGKNNCDCLTVSGGSSCVESTYYYMWD
jgi:hypothetical protein